MDSYLKSLLPRASARSLTTFGVLYFLKYSHLMILNRFPFKAFRQLSSEAESASSASRSSSRGRGHYSSSRPPFITKFLAGAGLLPFFYYGFQHDRSSNHKEPMMDNVLMKWESFLHVDLSLFKSGDQMNVRRYFLNYSASILSFVGAVHWGLGIANPTLVPSQLIFSVVPSLFGWLSLNIGGNSLIPYVILPANFLAVYFFDELQAGKRMVPNWYTSLRAPITAVVVAVHVFAYVLIREDERPTRRVVQSQHN
jgi:Protein of unknown function (DUF3429)